MVAGSGESGTLRHSHRSIGLGRGASSEAVLDGDRTVVLKTKGKVASTPRGNGLGRKSPMALPTPSGGIGPVRSKGRGAVARTTGTSA